MPPELTDPTLDYLLDSAGLVLTEAQKRTSRQSMSFAAMKARVRQPRGRMAEPAHIYGFTRGGPGMIPTIAEAARLIAAKKLSPVELTQDCLRRIAAWMTRCMPSSW